MMLPVVAHESDDGSDDSDLEFWKTEAAGLEEEEALKQPSPKKVTCVAAWTIHCISSRVMEQLTDIDSSTTHKL